MQYVIAKFSGNALQQGMDVICGISLQAFKGML